MKHQDAWLRFDLPAIYRDIIDQQMKKQGVDDAYTELFDAMSANEHVYSALTLCST
jgi:hypothetical protein